MRDRLIELLEQAEGLKNNDMPSLEEKADYLLSEGVIVPPCKIGDTVYEIQHTRNRIQEYEIFRLVYDGKSWNYYCVLKDGKGLYGNLNGFCDYEIGKTVFLSKEDAEKRLRELNGQTNIS